MADPMAMQVSDKAKHARLLRRLDDLEKSNNDLMSYIVALVKRVETLEKAKHE